MKLIAVALLALLPALAALPEVDKGKAVGNPTAPIKIEVFSDFTCPHCRLFHEQTLPLLMNDYVSKGKAYIVDRSFPLTGAGHQYSREAFSYAVAAARIDRYTRVADALYTHQATWAIAGNVWDTVSAVLTPAEQKKVRELAKDPAVLAEIEAEYQEGVSSGVNQTPTMIVTANGRRMPLPPAPNYEFLSRCSMVFSQNNLLRWIVVILRVALGGIFVYAAWIKLRDPWELFAMGIDSYGILPLRWVEFVARTLPWLEMVVGVLLIVGRFLRIATGITSLLLVVFFALMIRAYAKGMEINCGCFGPGETISWKTLLRDGSMLAGSLWLTWMALRPPRRTA